MAKLATMPALVLSQGELAKFGAVWTANGGNLSRTPPFSSSGLGSVFDTAIIETLERLARRIRVEDVSYMAEAISLVFWNPGDGSIDEASPSPNSPLRIEKFSIQVETAYVSRYKGLPPHAA